METVSLKMMSLLLRQQQNLCNQEARKAVMRLSGHWNRPYFNQKAQALLELSVFGTILIMLMGVLVNYGLRYNFQQQAMQEAFRKALGAASLSVPDTNPTSYQGHASYTLIKDRHIPDAGNPFGLGSVMPFSGSANVIRSFELDKTAETVEELPRVKINIQGIEFDCPSQGEGCTTARFREETGISPDSLKRYREIYGSTNVWEDDDTPGLWHIIDSAAGEIVNYESAVRQCRQIVDSGVCARECERARKGEAGDCASICSQPMNVPWYCANSQLVSTAHDLGGKPIPKYRFPVLEQLLALSDGKKAMGVQPDFTQTVINEARLAKSEDNAKIVTQDSLNYKSTMDREIIYNQGTDTAEPVRSAYTTTTQITACAKGSADCPYGYKITACEGGDCGQASGKKEWQTNW